MQRLIIGSGCSSNSSNKLLLLVRVDYSSSAVRFVNRRHHSRYSSSFTKQFDRFVKFATVSNESGARIKFLLNPKILHNSFPPTSIYCCFSSSSSSSITNQLLLFQRSQSNNESGGGGGGNFDPFGGGSGSKNERRARKQTDIDSTNQQSSGGNDAGGQGENDGNNDDRAKKIQRNALVLLVFLLGFYVLTSVNYYKQVKELEAQIKLEREKEIKLKQQQTTASAQPPNASTSQTGEELDSIFGLTNAPNRSGSNNQVQQSNLSANNYPAVNLNTRNGNYITWNDLRSLIARKAILEIRLARKSDVALVIIKPNTDLGLGPGVQNYPFYFIQTSYEDFEKRLNKIQDDLNMKPEERVPLVFKDADWLNSLVSLIVTIGMLYMFYRLGRFLFSKVQTMQSDTFSQFTKARYTTVDPHLKSGVPQVNFKDVAGLHEAKIEVKEFVDYLREPERFLKLGAKVPHGALLLGPPGCGKTLLAKAVANEANVPFFNIAGTEFIEVIGGVGAARVRDLFEQAKKQAPAIIYIDEIDAVGRKRSDSNMSSTGGGGSGELDQTLNQLLVSMDGLESNSNVVVLASTNRADILDKALLRPGRLDRHITIDLPTHDERIEILNVHMKGLKLNFTGDDKDQFISQLSHLTPGFSGADLANICNEAALMAVRDGKTEIDKKHFYSALERVLAGAEKKSSTISVEDRKLIAYHECGKVIVSWFHENSDLILKVSLLSRTNANSFAQYLKADKKLFSKDDLFDQMCLSFGGRVAESIVFDRYTTNSEKDLKRITQIAYAQIESLGMNEVVGNLSFPTRQEEKRRGMVGEKPYSKKLRNVIDLEVAKLTAEAHKAAEKTVREHLDKLHKLSEELLKRESLTFEEIVELIGEPVNRQRFKNIKLNSTTINKINPTTAAESS